MKTHFSTLSAQREVWRGRQNRHTRWWILALIPLLAANLQGASLSVGNARGFPGQTASVAINVREATNVVAAQFDLAYNTAKGTLNMPSLTGSYSNHVMRSREIAPGVRRVVVYSSNNALLRTNGFSGSFGFNVSPGERVGTGPIAPQNAVLVSLDGIAIAPVRTASGNVFVTPVFRDPSSGIVNLFLPSIPEQRYLVQATEDFVRWVNISNIVATSDFIDLVDLDAPIYPRRFYRTTSSDAVGNIGSIIRADNGQVILELTGLEGRAYIIQASTNLLDWQDIGTREATGGSFQFTDVMSGDYPQRFYRLQSEP